MDTPKAHRVILISTFMVLVIGTLNSMSKGSWPKSRFLIGTGVMTVGLSAFAEFEPEIAGPLSLAVLTTVLLGEGNGVLSWISDREIDTQKPKKERGQAEVQRREAQVSAGVPLGQFPEKLSRNTSTPGVGAPLPLDLLV